MIFVCLSSILTLCKNINHFYCSVCLFSMRSDGTCNLCLSDIIEKLISDKNQLDAVRFIYAFELVEKFPPVPLLKAHLRQSKKVGIVGKNKGHRKLKVHVPFFSSIQTIRFILVFGLI